ncbi:MAG: macro domain-containing protein [Chloroflexi bacterium]|nr:macro domain-containing protein [Chloroflexota bacterium]
MITFTSGDVTKADAEALINTVNCVGVMGRGIALQFKRRYPANFRAYAAACNRGEVEPGRVFVFETGQLTNPRYIINVPTKRHWRAKSRLEDIDSGLESLAEAISTRRIRSVAIPPLGCGMGGLDWDEVRPRIETALSALPDVRALVFEPSGAPERLPRTSEAPRMTAGRASLIGLLDRYLRGSFEPSATLLELHKLLYFLQESGHDMRLRYTRATYGPYAENLRHVMHQIEGHYTTGYSDGGDDPTKEIALIPGATSDANAFLASDDQARAAFDRVSELVDGFETPFGLELLASVHWVATRDGARSAEQAANALYAWNERKKQFTRPQIGIAWTALDEQGWLTPRTTT